MRRLTVVFAVALLAGCGSGSHQAGISVHVDSNPFRITILDNGKTVVAEDKGARLRYQLASNGDQYKLTKVIANHGDVYTVATNEPGWTATVTVRPTRVGAVVSMQLHPATNVQQVYDAFDTSSSDHFLGGGERNSTFDLRGQIVPVKVSAACAYAPIPFFESSAGWGLRLSTENVAAMAFPGSTGGGGCQFGSEPQCTFPPLATRAEVCVQGAALDEDLYVGDFAHVLADYEHDAGKPKVPPASEFELIKWRDVDTGPGQVLEDIHRLQAAHVPIGWVLVDNPWETCVGTLTFDQTRFPDPAGLIRQVHALGVRFMLWISPKVICGIGYPPTAFLGTPADRELDLTQPSVVHTFQALLRKLVALGIDGVKADRADEVDLQGKSESLENEYPLLFAKDVFAVLPKSDAAIFRAATMGSQSVVPGIWAGDQEETWQGLEEAIVSGETAGTSGFPTWGSDVGGYEASGQLNADLFARWAQLGAVSPIFEVGGQGPNATPWTLGAGAMTALRDAAVLHYELFPYFDSLIRAGQPVLRPLAYGYPDDPNVWSPQNYELLVGPDLLAAPVTGGGTTPSVYLPTGTWVDLGTGATVKGPVGFTRITPLDTLPLYARAGAVIPFNLRTATSSWWGVDELSHPGRAGYLATDGALLDLRGAPHDVQIFVPASSRPVSVTIGGKAVRWSWNAGPLPGVVVRLHGPAVRGRITLTP